MVDNLSKKFTENMDSWKSELHGDNDEKQIEDANENEDIKTKLNNIETELKQQASVLQDVISKNEAIKRRLKQLDDGKKHIESNIDKITKRRDIPNLEKEIKKVKRGYQDEYGKIEEN
eukprot:194432_1